MSDFLLRYQPRDHFIEFHQRTNRWASLVCHRRAGKTVACVNELVIRALYSQKRAPRYAYIAPFYKQAKDIAWQYLKEAVQGIATEIRESDLRVILPNGAWITLYGADNPDAIRGIYLDGVILDEYGDCRPSLWAEVILPTLADRRGWAVFIGTPKGKNHFFDIHQRAKKESEWYDITLPADASGILAPEELREMQLQMDAAQYAQEFLCDFTAAVKGTYYADIVQQLEIDGRTNLHGLYDPNLPVYASSDLGFSDSTSLWFWQEARDGTNVIKSYENQGKVLDHYIDYIENQPFQIEQLWLPHDARAKTLQTGRSTIEQMLAAGLPCQITPMLKVQHGIDAARMLLPTCHFDVNAQDGLEALRAYKRQYNELTKSFRDTPLHDWSSDYADAFRYLSLVCQRNQRKVPPTPMTVFKPRKYTLDELFKEKEGAGKILSTIRRRI